MKKGLFICLILSLITVRVFAQYFNKLHDFDSTGDWGLKTIPTPNGYFIFGAAGNLNGTQAIMGMQLDLNGNKISVKEIMKDTTARFESPYRSVKKLSSGRYISPIGNIGKNVNGSFSNAGFIMMNGQMDTLFYRKYTDTSLHSEYFWSCDTIAGGDIIFAGSHHPRNQGPATYKGILVKTRANGDLVWKKYFNTPDNNGGAFVTVETQADGKLLVGAFSGYFKFQGQKYYHPNNPWFLLFDTSGTIVYQKYISKRFAGGGSVLRDRNGGYIHWGNLDSFFTGNPLDFQNLPYYFAHLNDSFGIEWFHDFSRFSGKVYIWGVNQLPDGGYIVHGNEASVISKRKGWVSRFNKSGAILWERNYVLDTLYQAYLTDVYQRADKGFILTGMHKSGGNPLYTQDLWVLGVDSMGCPAVNCPWPTSIDESFTNSGELLEIYPNPNSGQFIMKTSERGRYFLYDLQGRLLDTRELSSGRTSVGMPGNCSAGTYIVKYLSAKGSSKAQRIVFSN